MMNLEYQQQIPENFDDGSRIWIYQSSRLFFLSEALQIEQMLENFVSSWQSHGAPVKGYANLFFGQFIVLMADESATGVSGCSTDSSVRLIKHIEETMKVQLFERQNLAFIVKDKVQLLPISQLNYAFKNDFINAETLYFDNTIMTKKELLEKWIVPIRESWLARRINLAAAGE
jgi:hypothetical protein